MPRIVAVITADVVASSRYGRRDRQRVDHILRAAFRDTEQHFRGAIHTRMAFRITAGDEFQCVIADVPRVLEVLTYIRAVAATGGLEPPLRFRASIGVGTISVTKRVNPYEQDGTAFVRSRRGLEVVGKGRGTRRLTCVITAYPETNATADAILSLADHVLAGWTVPQWEAVRWAVLRLTREEIARRLRIAHQNATKRLLAAGWPNLAQALDFLRERLRDVSSTPETVQGRTAPS